MKSSTRRRSLAGALALRGFVLSLLWLGVPGWLVAQTLEHRYSFVRDASDSVGAANGTLAGNAYVTNGLLDLPGGGNSDNPDGYVVLPNGIVTNDTSITVECWLTDAASLVWAETWCFGDSSSGPGAPPNTGTAYISLIPHSGDDDFRAAFNLTGGDEIDVVDSSGPLPENTEEYAVVTYDAPSTTARLYLNGVQVGEAAVGPNLSPANYGDTFNNWLGRDEWGGDPMFAGSIDELRIWNAAVSPLYITLSALAGPGVVLTNLTPVSVQVSVFNPTMSVNQSQQATVAANFAQVTNVPATTSATNWISSNINVVTVSTGGAVTAVGPGTATVSATVGGTTGTSATITVSSYVAGSGITAAYWQFNNPTNLGLDSSGLGNSLTTATGEPAYSSAGKFGGALYLDGNSTMTTLSGGFPLGCPTNASPYTIAVWEKIDTGCPNNGGFVGWGVNDNGEANNLRLNGANSADDYWYANDFVVTGLAANPMDGNWHAIAVTWDGTNETMYVDGVEAAERTPVPPNVQPTGFVVGRTTADVNFTGWLEDLLIANAALTPADIAVYQAGEWSASLSANPLLPDASPSNTVYAGTTVTLSAPVAGSPPFQYQWQENGTNISGGTAATLVLTNIAVTNSGAYDVVVGNSYGTNTSPALTVTVYPSSAPVFVEQPSPAISTNYVGAFVTFTAAVSGTLPIQLQWQYNGVNIPNATSASLTLASVQAAQAGNYTVLASNSVGSALSQAAVLTVLPAPNPSALSVLTYHNDNARDGANTNEVLLTPGNVNVSTFGRLITYPTDGLIIAEPLYVAGLVIPGQGTHNVVFVATENNSIYAFDADNNSGTNGGVLWHSNLGAAVSSFDDQFGNRGTGSYYPDIVPVVGITGTPVIDPVSGTLYVNVHTATTTGTATNFYHSIHALNITNGLEQAYSPVLVTNAFPGTGVQSTNGIVAFSSLTENQRPGLALAGGMVYVAYGSYADTDPYHGWVLGFNETNLAQSALMAFNTTPNATVAAFGINAGEGALWMGGDGPCVDASNNLYFATANGSFSANTNGGDYGDSFVKLATTNGALKLADYFTPYNQAALAANDTDLGSGGVILLPDSAGSAAHPHLLIGCGKDGILRLVDRDNMGKFNAAGDSQIVQEVPGAIGGAWSTPAYFNHHIYYQGSGDVMRSFLITNGVIVATPTSVSGTAFSALGGTPVISANCTNDGIVWTIQSDAAGSGGPAVLHAYNATNLASELYNSSQNLARDNPGPAIIMTTPTVANGKVFVGGQYELAIFGNSLFLATPVITPAGGSFTNTETVTLADATPNSTIYYTLDGTAPTTNSLRYTGPFVLSTSASVQAIATQPGAVNSGVASASFVDTSAVGTGVGLQGSYWANLTSVAFTNASFATLPTLVRVDSTINFNWTTTPPSAYIGLTNFVVRWTGAVQPEYNETYTFTTDTANGVRLYVNGRLLINQWDNQAATTWSNSITLAAQQLYNVEMDFFNQTGGAVAQLSWSSPSTPPAIIPENQLYPYTNPPPTVALSAPTNGATYTASASVTLGAQSDAPYNPVASVDFYANGSFLGGATNLPWTITATGLAAGNYTLTAVATDGSGLSNTSAPVNIIVLAASGLPDGLTNHEAESAFLNMPNTYNGTLPALLSETGAFSDTPNRTPVSGLIPYVPNTPLWSDNAVKSRYLGVPYSGGTVSPDQQIGFAPTGQWTFPAGTVFVKNFDLVVDQTNTNTPLRRLETRLLVRDINGAVYGVTYKWRPDNSDADLLSSSLTEAILITNATGVVTQNWYYPSPADCLTCHTPVAGYVLGVNARQLNGSETYPATGVTDNQLRTLNRLGLLNPAFNEAAIAGFEQMSSVTNPSVPLVQRARSYLDANCAQCHQPGGTGITFDARYDTPLTNQNIIGTAAAFSLGYDNAKIVAPSDVWRSVLYDRMNVLNPTIQMPPLARNLIDSNAVATMAAWINSLGGTPALPPPVVAPTGGQFTGFVSVTATEPATNATSMYYTLDGSLPTTNSTPYTGPIMVTNSATLNINAWAPGYVESVVDTVPYTILPGPYFTSLPVFTNGLFAMSLAGPAGSNYVLQVSTNLFQWTSLSTNTPATSPFTLTDPGAPGGNRFYRVLLLP
jgi:uncharacterized repeat protein (TIGR03806 family)